MSILNVNTIQPIGSGTTVTVAATELKTNNFITVGTGASVTSPSANVLTLGTNNAERLRITSAGLIGIGTVSPSGPIHVHVASGTQRSYIEASAAHSFLRLKSGSTSYNSGLEFFSGASNIANITGLGAGGLQFEVNGTERLRIRSDGRVTIGTQTINTNSMLSIHRSSSDETQIRFTNTTTGEGGNNGLLVGIDSNEHGRIFNQENTPIRFGTDNTERLRIRAQGPHLLIGTGGDATYNEITESSSNAGLVIGSSSMGNGGIVIRNSTSGTGRIYFADNSGSDPGRQRGQINYYHNGDYMMFATSGSERLRITSGGHVLPASNNTYDLGSTANGWRNVYMNDLNLSNMNGDTNDVDGTQGSWTIQEGKDDLYIINRLNGKKFKIKMEEIS